MIIRWGKYNPERAVYARKACSFGSKTYAPGDEVASEPEFARRIRQMYDAKALYHLPDDVNSDAPPDVDVLSMSVDDRRAWFDARGMKYDARWSDARVMELANGLA